MLFIESTVATEMDESLIEAVREYPYLYNNRSSEYKVQQCKKNAWSVIAELLEPQPSYTSPCPSSSSA